MHGLIESYDKRTRRELRAQAVALAVAVNDPKKLDEFVPSPDKKQVEEGGVFNPADFAYDDDDGTPWWNEDS